MRFLSHLFWALYIFYVLLFCFFRQSLFMAFFFLYMLCSVRKHMSQVERRLCPMQFFHALIGSGHVFFLPWWKNSAPTKFFMLQRGVIKKSIALLFLLTVVERCGEKKKKEKRNTRLFCLLRHLFPSASRACSQRTLFHFGRFFFSSVHAHRCCCGRFASRLVELLSPLHAVNRGTGICVAGLALCTIQQHKRVRMHEGHQRVAQPCALLFLRHHVVASRHHHVPFLLFFQEVCSYFRY